MRVQFQTESGLLLPSSRAACGLKALDQSLLCQSVFYRSQERSNGEECSLGCSLWFPDLHAIEGYLTPTDIIFLQCAEKKKKEKKMQ